MKRKRSGESWRGTKIKGPRKENLEEIVLQETQGDVPTFAPANQDTTDAAAAVRRHPG